MPNRMSRACTRDTARSLVLAAGMARIHALGAAAPQAGAAMRACGFAGIDVLHSGYSGRLAPQAGGHGGEVPVLSSIHTNDGRCAITPS